MGSKENKLKIFWDLLKEFDKYNYQKIKEDKNLVLDLYEGKYFDTAVIVYSGENTSYRTVSYTVTQAYKEITGSSLWDNVDRIKKEILNNYDCLADYYRVKDTEYEKRKTDQKNIIQKYKNKYEQLENDPLEITKIEIADLQKEVADLQKQLQSLLKS